MCHVTVMCIAIAPPTSKHTAAGRNRISKKSLCLGKSVMIHAYAISVTHICTNQMH